ALHTSEDNRAVAQQEHERATTGFQRGLQTIDDMIINLDGRLAKTSGTESVRVEFLREFLRFSQQLQQERPTDPAARRQLGRIWTRIADLRQQLRQFAEADQGLHQAVEVQKGLVADFPDQPQFRQDLATTHAQQARLLMFTRKFAAARAA